MSTIALPCLGVEADEDELTAAANLAVDTGEPVFTERFMLVPDIAWALATAEGISFRETDALILDGPRTVLIYLVHEGVG